MDKKPRKYSKKTDTRQKGNFKKTKRPFKCNPTCKFGNFKCSQKYLGQKFRNKKGWWVYDCKYADDSWCEGSTCKFAICIKRKMKADGTCGMTSGPKKVKKRDWDEEDEEFESDVDIKKFQKKSKVRIQDKAYKKFKKYDDY